MAACEPPLMEHGSVIRIYSLQMSDGEELKKGLAVRSDPGIMEDPAREGGKSKRREPIKRSCDGVSIVTSLCCEVV